MRKSRTFETQLHPSEALEAQLGPMLELGSICPEVSQGGQRELTVLQAKLLKKLPVGQAHVQVQGLTRARQVNLSEIVVQKAKTHHTPIDFFRK